MKPSDLTLALNAALVHLSWLNADRYQGALKLVAQVPIDLEAIGSSGGGDVETRDRRQIGGHSDPTGDAVASSADRQARLTDRAETICVTARNLRIWMAVTPMPDAPGTLTAAEDDLAWCAMVAAGWRPVTDESRHRVLNAAQVLYDECAALQCEVERALRYSATVAAGRPEPKARQSCRSCARFGLDVDVDRANRCRRCGDFWRTHGVMPTEAICRAWYACVDRITPGMILEAKAAGRTQRRRKTA